MLESASVLRYTLYGSCLIISSELLYHSYIWLKKKIDERSSNQEVCDVIWTNELTHSCVSKHRFYNSKSIGVGTSGAKCDNPFCSEKNIGRLIKLIDSAKYSIDLAMYTFTSFELSQAFLRALQRGVYIRIVSDREMAYSTGSQIIPLTKAGVPVRCSTGTVFMHHKYCILDSPKRVAEIRKKRNKVAINGQTQCVLLTGSLNWTNQGFAGNWENILITSNMKHIREYSLEFERMWHIFDVDLKSNKK